MMSAALEPLDFGVRITRVCSHLASAGYDSLLLTGRENIRWLTGFTGSNGWVLARRDELVLITDGRYGDQAVEQMAAAGVECRVEIGSTRVLMAKHLADVVGVGPLGFEGSHISFADHAALSAAVDVIWMPTNGVIEAARRTKDVGEIQRMAHASAIADTALAVTLPVLLGEPTETQFRDTLEAAMRQHGADGPSFATIVAAGANAAMPHHHPDSTRIVEGMTVVIDFGALYDGYHSDMTRTFTMGDPSPMQADVYEVVLDAQRRGVALIAPGVGGRAIDNLCRERIAAAGWGDWFTHGTGHGVGLQIHESPWLTQSYDDTLREADVVTVEPGVYRRDFGGVRIEDMVVVTTDGCQPLTKTPKDSPCLPSPPTT
jgi:Xaa-Pro aminopeptidase